MTRRTARTPWRALLRIAWRNVRKNWRHTVGSTLSIVVGFVAIGLFHGYLHDLVTRQGDTFAQRYMYGSFLVERRGASGPAGREEPFRFLLTPDDQRFLDDYLAAHAAEVDNRVRFLALSGLASTGRSGVMFWAWGYDVAEGRIMRGPWAWITTAGRPLDRAAPDAVMLARGLGALLDCEAEPPQPWLGPEGLPIAAERPFRCRRGRVQLTATTQAGQLNEIEPEIVGLFDAGLKDVDSKFLMMPLPLAQRLLDTASISNMSVRLARGVDARRFATDLTAAAARAGRELEAMPWSEHPYGEFYARSMQLLGLYRTFVVLIVVAIAGMSVFTTMLKAVTERTREIGALRSVGFRRGHVLALFALEAMLLAVSAAALGLGTTLAATFVINHSGLTYSGGAMSQPIPLTIGIVPGAYLFATVFLVAVAALAALLPARRAARMAIPDALGHV